MEVTVCRCTTAALWSCQQHAPVGGCFRIFSVTKQELCQGCFRIFSVAEHELCPSLYLYLISNNKGRSVSVVWSVYMGFCRLLRPLASSLNQFSYVSHKSWGRTTEAGIHLLRFCFVKGWTPLRSPSPRRPDSRLFINTQKHKIYRSNQRDRRRLRSAQLVTMRDCSYLSFWDRVGI
jgi:hypothetical protein